MKLEEAIAKAKILNDSLKELTDEYEGQGSFIAAGMAVSFKLVLDTILTALRPVSKEQVEKVWRGEWIKLSAYRGMEQYKCSKCGQEIYVPEFMGEPIYSFCPMCSSAMMDSSVDLMIDKLGEMKFE